MAIDHTRMVAAEPAPAKPQHWSVDPDCWRAYVEDLIYAASSPKAPGEAYADQVARRRRLEPAQRAAAVRRGDAMHEAIAAQWPEAPTGLALARFAWGDDLAHLPDADRQRQQRQAATIALCAAWLPKAPPGAREAVRIERDRRSGISEAQRQANAEQVAASMVTT